MDLLTHHQTVKAKRLYHDHLHGMMGLIREKVRFVLCNVKVSSDRWSESKR